MLNKYISIVIPCFKSSPELFIMISNLIHRMPSVARDFEILLIIDGEQPILTSKLDEEYSYLDKVKIIVLKKNFGQNIATRIGLELSVGDVVITMDDDGQHDYEGINKLIQVYQEGTYGIVYAKFNSLYHSKTRIWGSKILKKSLKVLSNGAYPEFVNSFRLVERAIVEENLTNKPIDLMIDFALLTSSKKVTSAAVQHQPRRIFNSNYDTVKLISISIRILSHCLFIYQNYLYRSPLVSSIIMLFVLIFFIDLNLGYARAYLYVIYFFFALFLVSLLYLKFVCRSLFRGKKPLSTFILKKI